MSVQPEILERGPFVLAGLAYRGAETSALSMLWDQLMDITGPLQERSGVFVGVGQPLDDHSFEYFAGMVLPAGSTEAPNGLELRTLPEARYAVFPHKGPVSQLPTTFELLYDQWFPKSGYEPGEYFLEIYDDRFIGATAFNSIIEIAIPIFQG